MDSKNLQNLPVKFNSLISYLIEGNNRFVNNKCKIHNFIEERAKTEKLQNPEIIILTCSDSRVIPEYIFDTQIGNLFVIRSAGNIISKTTLGSIEFALLSFNCPLFLVLGHQSCGAIISVYKNILPSENIIYLADFIRPAITSTTNQQISEAELINNAVKENIFLQMKKSIQSSKVIKSTIENGDLAIIGAYYHLDSGKVELLDKAYYR